MLKKLESQFNKLETQRRELLAMAVTGEGVGLLPNGRWSVPDILIHIVTAEQLSQAYLSKKLLGMDTLPDAGWDSWFRSALLTIAQRLPLKYRAPRKLIENTPSGLTLSEIQLRWDQSRDQLRQILETFDAAKATKAVYKHPRAGYMNISQMLTSYRDHIMHHRPQVVSRLRARG